MMTRIPTITNIFFTGRREVSIAENGAVIMPPISSPATMFQCCMPMVNINVIALVMVKINLATVELPITYLGVLPFLMKVPVTSGPQPPPPNESIKPPIRPRVVIFVFFFVENS